MNSMEMLIMKCMKVTDEQWNDYLVDQDKYSRLFSDTQRVEIKQSSLAMAHSEAEKIKTEELEISMLLKKMNVSANTVDKKEFLMPNLINFAQYQDSKILISKNFLDILNQNLPMLISYLGSFNPYDLLLYHELYHHIEETNPEHENAGLHLEIHPFYFITKRISPSSAGEIAAFEFARLVTGVKFHPSLIGIIGLGTVKYELAEKILDKLIDNQTSER